MSMLTVSLYCMQDASATIHHMTIPTSHKFQLFTATNSSKSADYKLMLYNILVCMLIFKTYRLGKLPNYLPFTNISMVIAIVIATYEHQLQCVYVGEVHSRALQ